MNSILKQLCDQDYVHNVKKYVNLLLHASKRIMVGQYMAHMNYVQQVKDTFPMHEHGLGEQEVIRKDRQNYVSSEKVAFKKVLICLENLIRGSEERAANPAVKGTHVYLTILWYYLEVFHSPVANLEKRIEYISTVQHFLGIWHNYIVRTHGLSIVKNFITRQTYTDILISCSFVVSLIVFMRDNFPNQQCCLDLAGTDCVEVFWSKNGQWVGNRRQYTFGDLSRNYNAMVRLEEIRVDPDGPAFAKPHPKQESVWHRQYPGQQVDLSVYPDDHNVLAAWQRGRQIAQQLAISVGMRPGAVRPHGAGDDDDDDDGDDGANTWFYQPFEDAGNQFSRHVHETDEDEEMLDPPDTPEADPRPNDFVEVVDHGDGVEEVLLVPGAEEVREVLANIPDLDNLAEDVLPVCQKTKPFVTIPSTGTKIYKSTMISSLNSDEKLSDNRLARVRQRCEYDRQGQGDIRSESGVGLFDDCALWSENKSQILGKVQRILLAGRHGSLDYRLPVEFNHPKKSQITVMIQVYTKNDETNLYVLGDCSKDVKFSDIICKVNLTMMPTGELKLPEPEAQALVELCSSSAQANISRDVRAVPQHRAENISDDGMEVHLVQPNPSSRSKRVRRVRFSTTSTS